jgi:uncharacterized protein YbaR (Trm112 family)
MLADPHNPSPQHPSGALLSILVCPLCKGPLSLHLTANAQGVLEKTHLLCPADKLAFPIRDGIPLMLPEEAQPTSSLNSHTHTHV